ncbi:MAG: glycosyltransferase [Candidatus Electrothrix communis]|nr:MAG: glycosyltransferase [Candidatus Electrothrix communis]
MNISVVILTYKRENIVTKLIEELSGLTSVSEILLVDNAPGNTLLKLDHLNSNLIYIKGNNDKGTASRNLGIIKSKGDIIICIDDDIFGLTDEAIEHLACMFRDDDDLGAICFKVLDVNGKISNWCHPCKNEIFFEKEFLTCEISEGAVAFRKNILNIVGLFPDDFFISHEGYDLALRIIGNRKTIKYSPAISVVHYHSQQGRAGWRRYYYDTRNLFLVWTNNMSCLQGVKYVSAGLIPLLYYSLRDGFLRYYFSGVIDGMYYFLNHRTSGVKLSCYTIEYLRICSLKKPGLFYKLKKRMFQKGISL